MIPEKTADIDADAFFNQIYEKCAPHSMTSKEKMYAMYEATKYILDKNIEGDIVECGLWEGGSLMIAALTLINYNSWDRKIYGYDTFAGMTKPEEADVNVNNFKALDYFNKTSQAANASAWCYSSLANTKSNLVSTNYPEDKIILVKGLVEETIPAMIPRQISLLRLDTDWYTSTYHELVHLFPLLSEGGVIIIDDYGYWKGAEKAVNEYFGQNNIKLLLNRIDNSGRMAIKN